MSSAKCAAQMVNVKQRITHCIHLILNILFIHLFVAAPATTAPSLLRDVCCNSYTFDPGTVIIIVAMPVHVECTLQPGPTSRSTDNNTIYDDERAAESLGQCADALRRSDFDALITNPARRQTQRANSNCVGPNNGSNAVQLHVTSA